MHSTSSSPEHKLTFPLHFIIPFLFAVTLLCFQSFHEMWRDELQAWVLARDSLSLTELLQNMRYEGHPPFWHTLLLVLTTFSSTPEHMQILHAMICTISVYLFVRHSPFTPLQKSLYPFGYFTLYEYGVISRGYSTGICLMFLALAIYYARGKSFSIPVAICLGLTSFTSVYGLMLATCLAFCLWLSEEAPEVKGTPLPPQTSRRKRRAFLVFACMTTLAILSILPAPDHGYAREWHLSLSFHRLIATFNTFSKSLLPFHKVTLHFRERYLLPELWLLATSGMLFVYLTSTLRHHRQILALFFAGTGSYFLFAYIKFPGEIRHHGHLFILMLICLWLLRESSPAKKAAPKNPGNKLITLILSLQVIAVAPVLWLEYHHPFSLGKSTALFIKNILQKDDCIAAYPDYSSPVLSAYLGRELLLPGDSRSGSYMRFDLPSSVKSKKGLTVEQLFSALDTMTRKHRCSSTVLVLRRPLEAKDIPTQATMSINKLTSMTEGIIGSENTYLYKLTRIPRSPHQNMNGPLG